MRMFACGFRGVSLKWAAAAVVLAASAAFLAFGNQESGPSPLAGGSGLRVAVVDLDKVLDQSNEWKDYQEEGRRILDKQRRVQERFDRQLRVLRSEYDNLPPGTDARSQKRAQIEAALAELEKSGADLQAEMIKQRRESLSKMFNKICEAVRDYAQEEGIDLVLKVQDLHVSPEQPEQMGAVLGSAQVLYARDGFDVSAEIVQRLNAAYPKEIREN